MDGGKQLINTQEVFDKVNLSTGMNVACLGCGNLGYFILPAAEVIGRDGKAYAVDIQKAVLDSVRGKARLKGLINLTYVRANLEATGSTKIDENFLDAAFLINVLFQNKNYGLILAEAARILKKGGKLMVIDWKKGNGLLGPAPEMRVDPELIKKLALEVKLQLEEQTEYGEYFWGLLFKKF